MGPGRRRVLGAALAALAGPAGAGAGGTGCAPALPGAVRAGRRGPMPALIKPPRLRPGATIGLLAPAGRVDEEAIARALEHVRALGFAARLAPHLRAVRGNYAGTVDERLSDLHAMFAAPDLGALWCVRGGSGAIGLVDRIDYRLLRRHPRIFIGYSDITCLHLAIGRHAGLVTFHGPVAASGPSAYTDAHLLELLMAPRAPMVLAPAPGNIERAATEPGYAMRTVRAGVATGRLTGGNLSLVAALAGTPYAANFRDALVFLEEVNEEPYRIDRWLTQLDLASGFARAAGVLIGICANCVAADGSMALDDTLDEHLARLTRPAVTGWHFGHIRDQFTLPLGIRARLDTAAGTLTLLEAAVS